MAKKEKPEAVGPKTLAKAIENGADPEALNSDLVQTAEERETQVGMAVSLRIAGASYTQIAKLAEYSSAHRARQAVERALASSADSPEDRDKQRYLADKRLNRLLQSVMPKATDPDAPDHLAYNARALSLVDRIMKLYGVDAPTQVQITPSDERIQEYVARMSALAAASTDAEEADILEADIVETEVHGN